MADGGMISLPPGPLNEATLGGAFEGEGIGLHTGKVSKVRVLPAPEGHGRVFRRLVKGVAHDVPALWPNRRSRPLCTALQVGDGPLVRTVEHLLAALSAHAVDNALIEIEGEELPIFDGSAEPWCARIREAGRIRPNERDTASSRSKVSASTRPSQRNWPKFESVMDERSSKAGAGSTVCLRGPT